MSTYVGAGTCFLQGAVVIVVKVNSPFKHFANLRRKLRHLIRKTAARIIADTIRARVRDTGKGASGQTYRYSDKPLMIHTKGRMKPIIRPQGADGRRGSMHFYAQGYQSYKTRTNQQDQFVNLTNKGNLWRDWKPGTIDEMDSAPLGIGFDDPANSVVYDSEDRRGRASDLFGLSSSETNALAAQVTAGVQEAINTMVRRK